MKKAIIMVAGLLLLLGGIILAQEKPKDLPKEQGASANPETTPSKEEPVKIEQTQQAEMEALIKQLGDEKAEIRNKAREELAKIGVPALPLLKKSMNSDNPWIKSGVRMLLEPFPLWVIFDDAVQKGGKIMGESKIPESEGIISLNEIKEKDGAMGGYLMEIKNNNNEILSGFYFNRQFIITKAEWYLPKDKKIVEQITGRVIYDAGAKGEYNRKKLADSGDKLEDIESWYGKVEGKLVYENKKTKRKGEYPFSGKLLPAGAMFFVPQLMAFSDECNVYEFPIFTLPSESGMLGGDIFWKVVCQKLGKEEIDLSGTKIKAYKFSMKMTIPFAPETERNPKIYHVWISEDGKLVKLGG